jgi:hydrogenase maturation factor
VILGTLPPETRDEDFRAIVDSIRRAALGLDIGHSGRPHRLLSGLFIPNHQGGITVFAIAEKGSYVTPGGARPSDDVIITKGPAIEATGILATLREEELLRKFPSALIQKAKDLCW